MCGITAIFAYHADAPRVEESELVAIRDHMTARGPDGKGEWFEAQHRVGLGHRRLAIIDLSASGAQPMLLPEPKLVITFNGEIYNYQELRRALEAKGRVFRSTSDTEVLLQLYAEHGEAMVNELRGMYAFAIWDGIKRGLFLARDPFGIKPLYLADDGRTLRVASQVKALLAGGSISTTRSAAGHAGFFLWGHIPEPFTLYQGIRALPPGTSLWLGEDRKRRENTFCSIPEIFSSAERNAESNSEPTRFGDTPGGADSEVGAPLRDSVAQHLIADVPVGVFLSAGLDSTTLASLAAEQGGTLRTATLGFEEFRGTANDEVPLAELMAKRLGAAHQTTWVQRRDFQDETARLFAAMDQPTTDGVNSYFVSLAARRAGLKVALSGLGGDELFGGYPSFAQLPRTVNSLGWLGAPSRIGGIFRVLSAPLAKRFTSPKYAGLLEYGGSYGGAYLLRRGMFMPWELPEFLDPDLVRKGWEELQPLAGLDETVAGLRSPRARVSALEICWYMRNQLLRDADWAGMAHSLEIRVPLVDVALARTLVPALVGANPPTKRDLADTLREKLPAEILNRPKSGFGIPMSEWLLAGSDQPPMAGGRNPVRRGMRDWARQVYSRFSPETTEPRNHRP